MRRDFLFVRFVALFLILSQTFSAGVQADRAVSSDVLRQISPPEAISSSAGIADSLSAGSGLEEKVWVNGILPNLRRTARNASDQKIAAGVLSLLERWADRPVDAAGSVRSPGQLALEIAAILGRTEDISWRLFLQDQLERLSLLRAREGNEQHLQAPWNKKLTSREYPDDFLNTVPRELVNALFKNPDVVALSSFVQTEVQPVQWLDVREGADRLQPTSEPGDWVSFWSQLKDPATQIVWVGESLFGYATARSTLRIQVVAQGKGPLPIGQRVALEIPLANNHGNKVQVVSPSEGIISREPGLLISFSQLFLEEVPGVYRLNKDFLTERLLSVWGIREYLRRTEAGNPEIALGWEALKQYQAQWEIFIHAEINDPQLREALQIFEKWVLDPGQVSPAELADRLAAASGRLPRETAAQWEDWIFSQRESFAGPDRDPYEFLSRLAEHVASEPNPLVISELAPWLLDQSKPFIREHDALGELLDSLDLAAAGETRTMAEQIQQREQGLKRLAEDLSLRVEELLNRPEREWKNLLLLRLGELSYFRHPDAAWNQQMNEPAQSEESILDAIRGLIRFPPADSLSVGHFLADIQKRPLSGVRMESETGSGRFVMGEAASLAEAVSRSPEVRLVSDFLELDPSNGSSIELLVRLGRDFQSASAGQWIRVQIPPRFGGGFGRDKGPVTSRELNAVRSIRVDPSDLFFVWRGRLYIDGGYLSTVYLTLHNLLEQNRIEQGGTDSAANEQALRFKTLLDFDQHQEQIRIRFLHQTLLDGLRAYQEFVHGRSGVSVALAVYGALAPTDMDILERELQKEEPHWPTVLRYLLALQQGIYRFLEDHKHSVPGTRRLNQQLELVDAMLDDLLLNRPELARETSASVRSFKRSPWLSFAAGVAAGGVVAVGMRRTPPTVVTTRTVESELAAPHLSVGLKTDAEDSRGRRPALNPGQVRFRLPVPGADILNVVENHLLVAALYQKDPEGRYRLVSRRDADPSESRVVDFRLNPDQLRQDQELIAVTFPAEWVTNSGLPNSFQQISDLTHEEIGAWVAARVSNGSAPEILLDQSRTILPVQVTRAPEGDFQQAQFPNQIAALMQGLSYAIYQRQEGASPGYRQVGSGLFQADAPLSVPSGGLALLLPRESTAQPPPFLEALNQLADGLVVRIFGSKALLAHARSSVLNSGLEEKGVIQRLSPIKTESDLFVGDWVAWSLPGQTSPDYFEVQAINSDGAEILPISNETGIDAAAAPAFVSWQDLKRFYRSMPMAVGQAFFYLNLYQRLSLDELPSAEPMLKMLQQETISLSQITRQTESAWSALRSVWVNGGYARLSGLLKLGTDAVDAPVIQAASGPHFSPSASHRVSANQLAASAVLSVLDSMKFGDDPDDAVGNAGAVVGFGNEGSLEATVIPEQSSSQVISGSGWVDSVPIEATADSSPDPALQLDSSVPPVAIAELSAPPSGVVESDLQDGSTRGIAAGETPPGRVFPSTASSLLPVLAEAAGVPSIGKMKAGDLFELLSDTLPTKEAPLQLLSQQGSLLSAVNALVSEPIPSDERSKIARLEILNNLLHRSLVGLNLLALEPRALPDDSEKIMTKAIYLRRQALVQSGLAVNPAASLEKTRLQRWAAGAGGGLTRRELLSGGAGAPLGWAASALIPLARAEQREVTVEVPRQIPVLNGKVLLKPEEQKILIPIPRSRAEQVANIRRPRSDDLVVLYRYDPDLKKYIKIGETLVFSDESIPVDGERVAEINFEDGKEVNSLGGLLVAVYPAEEQADLLEVIDLESAGSRPSVTALKKKLGDQLKTPKHVHPTLYDVVLDGKLDRLFDYRPLALHLENSPRVVEQGERLEFRLPPGLRRRAEGFSAVAFQFIQYSEKEDGPKKTVLLPQSISRISDEGWLSFGRNQQENLPPGVPNSNGWEKSTPIVLVFSNEFLAQQAFQGAVTVWRKGKPIRSVDFRLFPQASFGFLVQKRGSNNSLQIYWEGRTPQQEKPPVVAVPKSGLEESVSVGILPLDQARRFDPAARGGILLPLPDEAGLEESAAVIADNGLSPVAGVPWIGGGSGVSQVLAKAIGMNAQPGQNLVLVMASPGVTAESVQAVLSAERLDSFPRVVVASPEQVTQFTRQTISRLAAVSPALPPVVVLVVAQRVQSESGQQFTLLIWA